MSNVSTHYVVFLKADFLRCSALAKEYCNYKHC